MKHPCKKGFAMLLAVLMLACAFPLSSFAATCTNGHTWDAKVDAKYLKTAANCQNAAVYYKSCSVCGASGKDDSNAATLTFTDPSGKKDENNHLETEVYKKEQPATCVAKGQTAILTCKACKKVIGGDDLPIDPKNHQKIVDDPAVTATCTAEGKTAGSRCSACGVIIVAQKTVEKLPHTPATRNTKATCAEDGVLNEKYCSVCKTVLEKGTVIPKTGHRWSWTAPAGYTCTVGGSVTRTCSVCKTTETCKINPGDHAEVIEEGVAATCTNAGKTEGKRCQFCGVTLQQQTEIPALGHSFTGKVVSNKNGTHAFQCERCDTVGGTVDCTDRDRNCVCDKCGEAIPHTFTVYTPDGNATCIADGTKTAVCDICGKAKDTVPDEGSKDKAEHNYVFEAQNDATCMTNAHEVGTCTLCHATITREIANSALGHVDSEWKYPTGFDCTRGGYRYKECTRCSAETKHEDVAPAEHTRVTDPAVEVTCTTDGKTKGEHCSVCGLVFVAQAVIPAKGHKANAAGFTVDTKATCEKDGSQSAVCATCGETFTQVIPATGHKYVTTVVKPGCTAKGYTNHKCSVCGKEYNDSKTPATGHNWKITVKQATLKKDGSKIYVCTVCKKKVTKAIDKIQTVKLSATTLAKTGQKQTPTVTVKNSAGKTLKKGTAYTVKYAAGRKKLGTYTVTVTFIGNYGGSKTLKFRIVPAAPKTVKATATGKDVTLNWSKVSGGDKYVVYYSTAKNGAYKKAGTTADTTLTVKNLKAGAYYFKVRAVYMLGSGSLNGVLSAPAKVKVK